MAKLSPITLTAIAVSIAALPAIATAQGSNEVDFGDDSSEWASDGECDDARFAGEGVSASLVTENIGRDASDCSAAASAGKASLKPLFAPVSEPSEIDFGDDTSAYANNEICDDVRFTGEYAAETIYIVDDIGTDASDCKAAFEAGTATWQGNETQPANGLSAEDLVGLLSD